MPLYALTIFLSAFLLFQVQPMIAKMILPWFGGSAAVWTTALLFFQAALLGGYLYAHWSIRTLAPRMQATLHAALIAMSLSLLPITPALSWKPAGNEDPLFRILGLLAVSVGLPYLLLSATSPLMQAWYARNYKTALPYRLFALSNLASLLGLLAYPFLVERAVTLRMQALGWSAAYLVFAALGISAAIASRRANADAGDNMQATNTAADQEGGPPKRGDKVLWLLLAACSSTMLLAVTNHLTQNVASVPFLWVLPLSLYLLTFILCFDFEQLYNRTAYLWLLALSLGGMAYGLSRWNARANLRLVIPAFCAGLFFVCMFFHGELVRRKPSARHLTSFYLMLSAGGALGGILVGLVAPMVLPGCFELPIALVACAVLMLALLDYRKDRVVIAVSWAVAIAMLLVSVSYWSSYRKSARLMARNFYGALRVNEYERGTDDERRMLVHGTVDHGMEFTTPGRRQEHITYYGPGSGISMAIRHLRHSPLRIGVIGLGAGSLASFAEPGDVVRFYEINPLVEIIARSEFFYLAECRGKAELVLSDGRLALEREPAQQYDLLVADAFSGDAVPVHLLTTQALEVYFRHLKPSGILALNITNAHLELAPIVAQLAAAQGKYAVLVTNKVDEERKIHRAQWALVSSKPITSPMILAVAEKPGPMRPELRVWTDDYSNLFQVLK